MFVELLHTTNVSKTVPPEGEQEEEMMGKGVTAVDNARHNQRPLTASSASISFNAQSTFNSLSRVCFSVLGCFVFDYFRCFSSFCFLPLIVMHSNPIQYNAAGHLGRSSQILILLSADAASDGAD